MLTGINRYRVQYMCQKASGPFSYISQKGNKITALKWGFDKDGNFVILKKNVKDEEQSYDHLK